MNWWEYIAVKDRELFIKGDKELTGEIAKEWYAIEDKNDPRNDILRAKLLAERYEWLGIWLEGKYDV